MEGDKAEMWAPGSRNPNIVVKQGTVEDWIIENRTNELHDFHIHQLHFLWLESNGGTVDEPYLRDTVNVDLPQGQPAGLPQRTAAYGLS